MGAGGERAAEQRNDCSPSVATAIAAPPTGRMTVCAASQTESTHGILSATNSITYSTRAVPMIQVLSNTWYCGGSETQP